MRITVGDILGWLAAGMSREQIRKDFPELTDDDIRAALAFIRTHPIPNLPTLTPSPRTRPWLHPLRKRTPAHIASARCCLRALWPCLLSAASMAEMTGAATNRAAALPSGAIGQVSAGAILLFSWCLAASF